MASIINLASQRINSDTAGLTYLPEAPGQTPGSPVGLVPSEVAQKVTTGTSEGLGFITGGLHPEAILEAAVPGSHAEVVPTDSKPGRTGGLVPRANGTLGPGPAGAAAQARATLAKTYNDLRSRLKI
jgi:hypothetical protein